MKTGYPTFACMNGHAYAGGFMLAMAHDFRLMKNDDSVCCMSEINIGAVLPRGMTQLIKDKCTPDVARDMMVFGAKLTSKECHDRRIVD